jgi:nucleotide-binding universal stress UspA family protein
MPRARRHGSMSDSPTDRGVIVVGSRGLNPLRQDVIGSTSHELALHAGPPVLMVPPENHI